MMAVSIEIELRGQSPAREDEATAGYEGFAALVRRQSRFVFQVAYSVLRNPHDAEDVVQETFLRIYRGRKWEDIIDQRAFLARTAWRIAVDRLPKVRMEAADPRIPAGGENPEQAAATAELNAAIHRLVDSLPEELRQPLALSTVEEMNSHDIAKAMGIHEGTVRTRLLRARRTLRQKLAALMEGRHGR